MTDTRKPEAAAPAALPPLQAPSPMRLGGLSPLFAPASVADEGKLRLGGLSPLFARG